MYSNTKKPLFPRKASSSVGGVHKNSKVVTIFCQHRLDVNSNSKDPEVQGYLSQSQLTLGSYFQTKGSAAVGTGLYDDEKDVLLSRHLNITKRDPAYLQKIETFFVELRVKVPYRTGLKLQIGMTVDNNAPASEENLPLNIFDYIRYRFIREHPNVALSKEEAQGNKFITHYIYDKETVINSQKETRDLEDKAFAEYLSVKKSKYKVNAILAAFGENLALYSKDDSGHLLKEEKIRELIQAKPARFLELVEDANLDTLYWLNVAVKLGVILERNGAYIYDKTEVAFNMDDLGTWFRHPQNSEKVVDIKTAVRNKNAVEMLNPEEIASVTGNQLLNEGKQKKEGEQQKEEGDKPQE